jgi:Protein of unknown function (DUF5818)
MKKIVFSVAGALLFLAATPQLGLASIPRASQMQEAQPETKSFTGTVMKQGEKFVLSDTADKTDYVLDDAQKASQFEGKKVKVTGTVDMANNTIHVETIQEVA